MQLQTDEIIGRLITEFGYPSKGAEEVAQMLLTCMPVVQEAFEKWWRGDGLDAALEAKGYTLKRLIEEFGYIPIAAFLDMDWLIREPEEATKALARGYDSIE